MAFDFLTEDDITTLGSAIGKLGEGVVAYRNLQRLGRGRDIMEEIPSLRQALEAAELSRL